VIFGTCAVPGYSILALLEDASGDEFAEPRDQHVGGDAEVHPEVGEPGNTGVGFAKDQQRPAFTDHVEGTFDRTLGRGRLIRSCRRAHHARVDPGCCYWIPLA
jgi:hypothetical protein